MCGRCNPTGSVVRVGDAGLPLEQFVCDHLSRPPAQGILRAYRGANICILPDTITHLLNHCSSKYECKLRFLIHYRAALLCRIKVQYIAKGFLHTYMCNITRVTNKSFKYSERCSPLHPCPFLCCVSFFAIETVTHLPTRKYKRQIKHLGRKRAITNFQRRGRFLYCNQLVHKTCKLFSDGVCEILLSKWSSSQTTVFCDHCFGELGLNRSSEMPSLSESVCATLSFAFRSKTSVSGATYLTGPFRRLLHIGGKPPSIRRKSCK